MLSLVIPTLDEGLELHETLLSVFEGSATPHETIVVDDGGTDDSCAVLRQPQWRARGVVVHRIERSGVAAARNMGASLATKPYLVFLDAHCRVEPDWLARLQVSLHSQPAAIHAPAIRDLDNDAYGCGARLIDPALRYRWRPPLSPDRPYPLPIAPGTCLALSRATFAQLNGFGKFRELGLEDVDFSLRAWRTGIDVLAVPTARLAHRFRPYPPYRLSSLSRGYNVARVALVHFEGNRRDQCLRTIIGTPRAADALVEALSSDWERQRDDLALFSVRTIDDYFDKFGDWN